MNYADIQPAPMAVYCRGLTKSLGSGKSKIDVLCGLNMSVPQGAIYGLLGASGCGKTTLLKCVIGRMQLDGGHLRTLGKVPGSRGHDVPGKMVGYMPQDISLFKKLTIRETLTLFGRLHGMTKRDIKKGIDFSIGFLNLPDDGRLVETLSGGQQRRVSLAAALLHQPELLILDEPTVGVDPVLREKIWEHLFEIAKSRLKTTIIVTTHYIEEAAQANKVGLMRGGRLLAENKPTTLMAKYSLQTLEGVFLYLCHRDRLPNNDDSELLPSVSEPYRYDEEAEAVYRPYQNEDKVSLFSTRMKTSYGTSNSDGRQKPFRKLPTPGLSLPKFWNIMALCAKNYTVLKRNYAVLVFYFLVPVIQIVLFCVCIGGEPMDLNVSICNEDAGEMGGIFLSFLSNKTIRKVMHDDLDSAIQDVRMGWSWAAMHLGKNFTRELISRLEDGISASNETLFGSTVWLHLDMTNQEIAYTLEARIVDSFNKFARTLLESLGHNPELSSIPVGLAQPVYGFLDSNLTDFMACGLLVSATFFFATGLTSLAFVIDRKEGVMERLFVTGVSAIEIMISHVLTQILIMLGQTSEMLLIALFGFNITNNSNIVLLIILIVLQGLCGMTLGMVISSFSSTEITAIQATLGCMYPLLLTTGIIWPIEAMPNWMMKTCQFLPITIPVNAVRAMMGRGWSLDMPLVWSSYLISVAWIFINSIIAGFIFKFKK